MKKEEKSLDELWETSPDEFFGIQDTELEVTSIEKIKDDIEDEEETVEEETEKKEVKKRTSKKKEVEKEVEKGEKEEEKFFEKEVETEEETKVIPDDIYKTTFQLLQERGFVEEDVTDLNEDTFDEVFEGIVEKRLEERMKDFVENDLKGDEETMLFLEFKKRGGRTIDFLRTFETEDFLADFTDEELETEDGQKEFLKYYYLEFESDMDKEDVAEKISFLEERGKLDVTAKKFYDKLKAQSEKQKAELLEKQKRSIELQKQKQKEYRDDLKKTLDEVDSIGKIKINKKDKTELLGYLMSPTEKTERGFITGFQKDLAEVYADKKKLVALAKIIRDKFDIKDLDVKSEVTKEIKNSFRRGSQKSTGKSLAEFF